jgi:3'(2'), 5'-bisphosphate nucleotidase
MVIRDDHSLAADLATEAGERLLQLRKDRGFNDPVALKKAGDRGSHEFLTESLVRLRPSDSVLSEEGERISRSAKRVWIVDPLDGTREFAEEGRTDWAVHVALWEDGALTAGAVALPAQGRTLSTARPPALPRHDGQRIRIAVSRTRPPAFVQRLAYLVGADLTPLGSAGAKIAAVLTGDVEAYVHAGGQYEWDSAAPVAVALKTGAHASRIDGAPLTYNQEDPLLPDILVSLPDLAPKLLAGISHLKEDRNDASA